MTAKEKQFIVYMYEKPALFLKKYLVPPSMLLLCEKEGERLAEFGILAEYQLLLGHHPLFANGLRAEKKILTLYL